MGNNGMQGIRKTTFREIKSSFGRFMAIFAITALGVGFFAGLKVTKTAMLTTVREYLNNHGFYDFRLVSTLGFEQENVDTFQNAKDVAAAEGSVSFDILYNLEDGGQGVVKAFSVTQDMNTLKLVSGRMPLEENECVADSGMLGKSDIGSTIYLSEDNAQEDLEHFTCREYTVVGLVQSPLYLQYERGNTTLGTGRLDGFIGLLPEGFSTEYYTDIYVKFDRDYGLYSQEYDDFMEEKERIWEKLVLEEALARYEKLRGDTGEEIAQGRSELEEKKAQGERELADAAKTLEEAEAQLADARRELEEGEEEIRENQAEIDGAKALLKEKEAELNQGEATLKEKETELAEAKKLVDSSEVTLRSGERQLADGKAEWRSKKESVETMKTLVLEAKTQIEIQSQELARQKADLQAKVDAGEISGEAYNVAAALIESGEQTLAGYQQRLAEKEAQLAEGEQQLESAWQQVVESEQQLNNGWLALADAKQQLSDGQIALADGKKEIADGRKALEQAREELAEGEEALAEGKKELEEGRAVLEEKEAEFAQGKNEYEEAEKEFDTRIAEAEAELADAESRLADLEEPDVYVLGRDTNIGYVCFQNDSNIIEGIANIFPVFFFLVAALVCITTMNRMVEEQRTQIGVLKALGYGEITIMAKYMIYSGLAALSGCVFGFLAGTWAFPRIIWFCYGMMYRADAIVYVFDWKMALISLTVSLLCSIGATWLSCRVELREVAAALMRPKAPRAGRRVLLERISFVWKRLGFLRKVSLRNIFRYKKRLFMMVIGISGCTALLVTGFGIKDSIADVAYMQFREIQTYDIGISLKEAADQDFQEELDSLEGVAEYTFAMERNMDFVSEEGVKSVYLVVGTEEGMKPFLNLHTRKGEAIPYPGEGEAVITDRLAEDYKVSVGDRITLRDENLATFTVTVSGICENYIYNYVHISEDAWRKITGEEPERKTVYLNMAAAGEDTADAHGLSAELMKLGQVANVTVNEDFMDRIGNMMASLDIIVVVVIVCAAGLAFIVLYNLTNINITERVREIATIKVLGFYKRETAAYVFRENIMLAALGMACGMVMGYFLHIFVMHEIRVDLMSFDIRVKPVSYVYSGLLTLGFAWCVNKVMEGKLDRISMTESLKSVD